MPAFNIFQKSSLIFLQINFLFGLVLVRHDTAPSFQMLLLSDQGRRRKIVTLSTFVCGGGIFFFFNKQNKKWGSEGGRGILKNDSCKLS